MGLGLRINELNSDYLMLRHQGSGKEFSDLIEIQDKISDGNSGSLLGSGGEDSVGQIFIRKIAIRTDVDKRHYCVWEILKIFKENFWKVYSLKAGIRLERLKDLISENSLGDNVL